MKLGDLLLLQAEIESDFADLEMILKEIRRTLREAPADNPTH